MKGKKPMVVEEKPAREPTEEERKRVAQMAFLSVYSDRLGEPPLFPPLGKRGGKPVK